MPTASFTEIQPALASLSLKQGQNGATNGHADPTTASPLNSTGTLKQNQSQNGTATATATLFSPTDQVHSAPVNPFYSPGPAEGDGEEEGYEYERYKPHFPAQTYPPLTPVRVTDAGHRADPGKKALLGAAARVVTLTPAIGTELRGVQLAGLSSGQRDELALLVAERGVVYFPDQKITVEEQLELARHFGPLHRHATTPVPREAGLEDVHVVYNDSTRRPDASAFTSLELWHSDVSYELQPPSTTSLRLLTAPSTGGDTRFSSGYALYSSLSRGMQVYLEGLRAVHSGAAQAAGARAAGTCVRRGAVESVHPVVRVHPVTGWKSVYVNPGFTRRIVGVGKGESEAVLGFLFARLAGEGEGSVRVRWARDGVAVWDNRVVAHSATFDFWPERRHAVRATPHGEQPLSVAEYEQQTGRKAKDRQAEIWAAQGVQQFAGNGSGPRGYND